MTNHTDDEFGIIVRAYFEALNSEDSTTTSTHEEVVDVLRGKPGYAMVFLTPEERRCGYCKREDCEWHMERESNHDCPGFVQDAMFAQMENLNNRQRKRILKQLIADENGDSIRERHI